jgi:hypothetical protein
MVRRAASNLEHPEVCRVHDSLEDFVELGIVRLLDRLHATSTNRKRVRVQVTYTVYVGVCGGHLQLASSTWPTGVTTFLLMNDGVVADTFNSVSVNAASSQRKG